MGVMSVLEGEFLTDHDLRIFYFHSFSEGLMIPGNKNSLQMFPSKISAKLSSWQPATFEEFLVWYLSRMQIFHPLKLHKTVKSSPLNLKSKSSKSQMQNGFKPFHYYAP